MPQLTVRLAKNTYLKTPVVVAAERFAGAYEVFVSEDVSNWIISITTPRPIPEDMERQVLLAVVDEILVEFQRQYPLTAEEQRRQADRDPDERLH